MNSSRDHVCGALRDGLDVNSVVSPFEERHLFHTNCIAVGNVHAVPFHVDDGRVLDDHVPHVPDQDSVPVIPNRAIHDAEVPVLHTTYDRHGNGVVTLRVAAGEGVSAADVEI